MQGPYMTSLLGAIGAQLDANAEVIMQGRLQGNPYAGGPNATREGAARLADGRLIECEPLVLEAHAAQRGIPLYQTESVLSKRIRVADWWNLHAQRGTHRGEFRHVRPYFALAAAYPRLTIAHRSGSGLVSWHQVSTAGAYSIRRVALDNFNYYGDNTRRSTWTAFVEMAGTGYTAPNLYDDGHTYDDGSVYDGGSFSVLAGRDIAQMFYDWKAAHSWLSAVILVWPPATLDITATPTQDPSGWWNLPTVGGTWAQAYDPVTHLATRPPGYQWVRDTPAP